MKDRLPADGIAEPTKQRLHGESEHVCYHGGDEYDGRVDP
jgi:hypothetical protein